MIDSPQNQHVKLFRSLAEAKHRREAGLFALEGRRLIEEALKARAKLVWAAYSPDKFTGPEADRLLHALLQANVELLEIAPRAFAALSHTGSPPGIVAVARLPQSDPAASPATHHAFKGGGARWLLGAWEIRDPGNMGTLVRIAHAFGAAAVLALGDCVDFWDPKVVRASTGSVMWVPLIPVASWEALQESCRSTQFSLLAADMEAAVPCDEADYPERCVLLVGSEAHGLPEEVLAAADLRVTIPMPGGAESLNAAVAAGIVAFQISRKLAH